ncbi:MAG: decaprenyl-phosphate phosphoribosyltransferase [Patescibacteria group bacterium]
MTLFYLFKALRPRQWLKNVSLYGALFFWGSLFDYQQFTQATKAFIIFCCLSSSMYLINDLVDINKDRLHPFKKMRPLAAGKVGVNTARLTALILLVLGLSWSFSLDRYFFIISLTFVILEISYSFFLKRMIIVDALTVATAFILRFYAGSLAIHVSLSSWLVLTTIGVSLLLAFGKRRSERTLLAAYHLPNETRETLKHYPDTLLDSMISMSASFAIITYALFTFQVSSKAYVPFLATILPPSLARPKWMMLTILLAIYSVARYLYIIYEKKEGESPERVIFSDKPLLVSVALWGFAVLTIIYGLGD